MSARWFVHCNYSDYFLLQISSAASLDFLTMGILRHGKLCNGRREIAERPLVGRATTRKLRPTDEAAAEPLSARTLQSVENRHTAQLNKTIVSSSCPIIDQQQQQSCLLLSRIECVLLVQIFFSPSLSLIFVELAAIWRGCHLHS